MWVYRTKWMLPGDFTCDHCKLVWVSRPPAPALRALRNATPSGRAGAGLSLWRAPAPPAAALHRPCTAPAPPAVAAP
jgi:hypothetical protein